MKFRFRSMLALLLAGTLAFSCEKNQLDEVAPVDPDMESALSAGAANLSGSNLIFEETFEGSTAWSMVHRQFGTSHAFNVATKPVFQGTKSGRFELRDSDPETSGGTRSEVLFPELTHKERWYSFSAYFPSDGYKTDKNNDILNQWHQGGGLSPAATFRVQSDRFQMRVGNTKDTRVRYDIGEQTKDTWHHFVFHFIHSAGADGLLEVWHNGKKVLTLKGGNMYDLKLPRWKVGIYKDNWNGSGTTDSKVRIFYLDNVRMGNEKATLADMTSAVVTSTPTPTPTPEPTPDPISATQAVTSFTLINADTDKDIMTIRDGATISLRQLGTTKLNFRANTNPSTVGSVSFVMTGPNNQTFTDNTAPYALLGDDGNGKYFHGKFKWNTGTYTLTATPHTSSRAGGNTGTPRTIKFTVTR
jgi:hypothetical protein